MGKTVRAGKKVINSNGIKTVGGVPPYRETIGYVARGLVVYRLLRTRQMFPGVFEMAVYPPAVSESVARVLLNEPELSFNGSILTQINNPIFWNAETAAQNFSVQSNEQPVQPEFAPVKFTRRAAPNEQLTPSVISVELVTENSSNDDEKVEKPTLRNEVFYEPRTGERFQNRDGKIERLQESGERIVGEQTRGSNASSSHSARGTFFGGSVKQVIKK